MTTVSAARLGDATGVRRSRDPEELCDCQKSDSSRTVPEAFTVADL